MKKSRVLVIGLDGYEQSLGNRLIADGKLPALASLAEQGASWLLDHGAAVRTGLAWEHFQQDNHRSRSITGHLVTLTSTATGYGNKEPPQNRLSAIFSARLWF